MTVTDRKMRAAERRLSEARALLLEALELRERTGGIMRYGSVELAQAADATGDALRRIGYARDRMAQA